MEHLRGALCAMIAMDPPTPLMTTFARDDASRKSAAARAKAFMCRGMASSRCERQVCMEACLVLNDQPCVQQKRYVIEHGPAPKY